jgi:hypothetical protein
MYLSSSCTTPPPARIASEAAEKDPEDDEEEEPDEEDPEEEEPEEMPPDDGGETRNWVEGGVTNRFPPWTILGTKKKKNRKKKNGRQEISYYFPNKTMWRSFFCAMVAAFALQAMNPFRTGNLVMFQVSYDRDWHFFEVIFFVILGVFGVRSFFFSFFFFFFFFFFLGFPHPGFSRENNCSFFFFFVCVGTREMREKKTKTGSLWRILHPRESMGGGVPKVLVASQLAVHGGGGISAVHGLCLFRDSVHAAGSGRASRRLVQGVRGGGFPGTVQVPCLFFFFFLRKTLFLSPPPRGVVFFVCIRSRPFSFILGMPKKNKKRNEQQSGPGRLCRPPASGDTGDPNRPDHRDHRDQGPRRRVHPIHGRGRVLWPHCGHHCADATRVRLPPLFPFFFFFFFFLGFLVGFFFFLFCVSRTNEKKKKKMGVWRACGGGVCVYVNRNYPHFPLFASCKPDVKCITPGTYAMIGAAAALGGVTRMTGDFFF